jgi:hypothetical protein
MSFFSRYDKGDWNAICDVCGRKYKASLLKQRWDGLMCCPQDWEIRQPQDFVRGVPDPQLVPFVRDEPSDSFIDIVITSFNTFFSNVVASMSMVIVYKTQTLNLLFPVSTSVNITTVIIPARPDVVTTINGDAVNNQYLG